MKVAVFSTKPYDRQFLGGLNDERGHALEMRFFDPRLTDQTVKLAEGYETVCVFVNDVLDAEVLRGLAAGGTRLIALRCAGFNNVDMRAAAELGLTVARVPAYSPYAVAEHTVGLMLALNRKIYRAYGRVREGNFAIHGLLGFDMRGRTVGVVGTGRIGVVVGEILRGFGCELLAFDKHPSDMMQALGADYVSFDELCERSDIITLHCPLTPETHHMISDAAIDRMRDGAMLINTSRGGLVDTAAVIAGLKRGRLGYVGLDVYEEEADFFFEDLSDSIIRDDDLARLLTFPNVLVTSHQAFFTADAMRQIAETTLGNISRFASDGAVDEANAVRPK
ncbi:MAG: 2-hydroxyacid dehydrogenase [Phycisphaera sp.]|nr:2-hydroxyacid dehydrogenase [Phycisphaera sp.]